MAQRTYTKDVHAPTLAYEISEINSSQLNDKYTGMSIAGTQVIIHLTAEPDAAEELALNDTVAAHSKQNAEIKRGVEDAINKAMEFGKQLVIEYGAKNIMEGKTTADVQAIAVKLSSVQNLLMSGSLYAARAEMDTITPDALVTQEALDEFKSKLDLYLGL